MFPGIKLQGTDLRHGRHATRLFHAVVFFGIDNGATSNWSGYCCTKSTIALLISWTERPSSVEITRLSIPQAFISRRQSSMSYTLDTGSLLTCAWKSMIMLFPPFPKSGQNSQIDTYDAQHHGAHHQQHRRHLFLRQQIIHQQRIHQGHNPRHDAV